MSRACFPSGVLDGVVAPSTSLPSLSPAVTDRANPGKLNDERVRSAVKFPAIGSTPCRPIRVYLDANTIFLAFDGACRWPSDQEIKVHPVNRTGRIRSEGFR